MDTVSLADVNALGEDDRKAVMEMVRDGEMEIAEAIAKVKELASKKVRARAGAVKRKRGRLEIEITVLKSHFSIIIMSVKKARDLMQVGKATLNPFVKAYISPSSGDVKPSRPQATKSRKQTTNPMFDEQFKWEIETARARKGDMRLHVSVETVGGGWSRSGKKVIGCMTFAVDELLNAPPGVPIISGWYRLLDIHKGMTTNMAYRHHKPLKPPVEASPAPGGNRRQTAVDQSRPLPQLPGSIGGSPKEAALRASPADLVAPAVPARSKRPTAAAPPDDDGDTDGDGDVYEAPVPGNQTAPKPAAGAAAEAAPPAPVPPRTSVGAVPQDIPAQQAEERNAVAKPAPTAINLTVDSFTYLKVLGQGSFGKVLLAEQKDTGKICAIKVIKKMAVIEDDDIEATMTERRVLALSDHCPFLTGLYATFQGPDKLFYVMELIGGGDLMFHIQSDKIFTVDRARFYAAEICLGLWFLHSKGVIYRDLKLDNVMLDEWGHIKIADFGMCKENVGVGEHTTTFCGTPGYLAPEIINEKPYNGSVDWWSLGVLMYEMLIGDSPFDADDDDDLFRQILTLKLDYPKSLPVAARDVCQRFLTRDPAKRLGSDVRGAAGIKEHPFFAALDWEALNRREIKPPFAPERSDDKTAAVNFDEDFTSEDPTITPPSMRVTREIDQTLFQGFSFATPSYMSTCTDAGGTVDAGADHGAAAAPAAPTIEDMAWYMPDMSRDQAATYMRNKPIGTCVIRRAKTQPDCFVLVVSVRAIAPWSGLIVPAHGGGYRIGKGQAFPDMIGLVKHYSSHPIATTLRGAPVTLRGSADGSSAC